MTKQEREELRIFVGKNADYYISKWEEISENKISWNWAAFSLVFCGLDIEKCILMLLGL